MRLKYIIKLYVALACGTASFISQAKDQDSGHIWMPKKPGTVYWQAPDKPAPEVKSSQHNATSALPSQAKQAPLQHTYKPPSSRPFQSAASYPAPLADTNAAVPPPPQGPYRSTPFVPGRGAANANAHDFQRYDNYYPDRNRYYNPPWEQRGRPYSWRNRR